MQAFLVVLKFFPGDVTRMGIGDEGDPVRTILLVVLRLAVWADAHLGSAEEERACVAWIVQRLQDARIADIAPDQLALANTRLQTARELQVVVTKVFQRGAS